MKHTRTLHYVLSTHWDREWYLPFQAFRRRLVRLMDQVLDRIEDGTLAGPFTGDGQSILIEDYLAMRPERTVALRKQIEAGQMVFGPWYALPDEFLVSGESLIRNLEVGRELVRAFGGVSSNAGFLCDMFGHNSQMPQIFAGFGITGAFVWRGVDASIGGQFVWEGADGTRLPTYRFGKGGYSDFTFEVRHSDDPDAVFDRERARSDITAFFEKELARMGSDAPALVFDGGDHLFPDLEYYAVLKGFMTAEDGPYRLTHSTLDAFLEDLPTVPADPLKTVVGELRDPARWPASVDNQYLIPGVGSSRVVQKQKNAACEALLCQWAEPFAAFASLVCGSEYPYRMLHEAWVYLLKNQPHDSICGCSIDEVHQDMDYRFRQCRQIAECVISESLVSLTATVPGDLGDRECRLTVFNPLPVERNEVVEFDVEIPSEWPEFGEFFGYETKPAFRLFDAEGTEIAYHRLEISRNVVRSRLKDMKFPQPFKVSVIRVAARLKIPSLGFTMMTVVGASESEDVLPTRHPANTGLRTGHASMENAFLSVELKAGGTLTLTDKKTGQVYENLNVFQDDLDIGDGWSHGPTTNRHDVLSGGGQAQIELVNDTPLVTTFVVRQTLALPESFDVRSDRRADQRVPVLIESRLTLRADAHFVEVDTRVYNTANDHRLCVLFPTNVTAETYLSDSPFDVVERPIALREDNHEYREIEVAMKPQQTWAAVFDGERGLAVVTAGGQLESSVLDRADRPIALTLFRSTSRTVLTNGEPDGQLHGQTLRFQYRLVPFSGEPDRTVLFSHAQALSGGLRTVQMNGAELVSYRADVGADGPIPSSLMRQEGAAVLSSVRFVDETLEARFFNPTEASVTQNIESDVDGIGRAAVGVDFESNPTGECVSVAGHTVVVALERKQICTVRLKTQ